jgi:5-methyltetrahydropteroyltriglutamate--homocysteine methyltransferase
VDIENLRAAVESGFSRITDAFMTSPAPGTFGRDQNRYYRTQEEFLFAIADALRVEYAAITGAGFILQIDDPGMAENWDAMDPSVTLEEYRAYARLCIDALNHALAGIPEERVRYHMCWGSWHGPHLTDIPLRDVVDLLLTVRAGAYSLEAGNVRHEHEWKVWRDVKLPDGKMLIPGVVSHATNVVEHPELVADRILQYAQLVGRENVIAGTDCGLGGRIHASLAWAKLRSLVEGARASLERPRVDRRSGETACRVGRRSRGRAVEAHAARLPDRSVARRPTVEPARERDRYQPRRLQVAGGAQPRGGWRMRSHRARRGRAAIRTGVVRARW